MPKKIEVLTLINQNNKSIGSFVKYEDYCELQSDYDELVQLLKEAESTDKGEDYYTRYSKYIKEN